MDCELAVREQDAPTTKINWNKLRIHQSKPINKILTINL